MDLPIDYEFTSGSRPSSVPGWDSLSWVRIILKIESELEKELSLEIFDNISTVHDFCNAVSKFSK